MRHVAIYKWIKKYVGLMEKYLSLHQCRADIKKEKSCGSSKKNYLVMQ
jgi:hypothetical protein